MHYMHNMSKNYPNNLSPSELVRSARKRLALSQADFAQSLSRSQSVISRYESGGVEPEYDVIKICMHIMHNGKMPYEKIETEDSKDTETGITVEGLAKLVKKKLRGDSKRELRLALSAFLKSIV